MIVLKAKVREYFRNKVKKIKKNEVVPAVLYGPKIKNLSLEINLKEFESVYKKAGESSLISLEILPTDKSGKIKKFLVLIYKIQNDPQTGSIIHIDFYQPVLTEEVEISVPLVFEGESLAVKDLGGTLIKEIQELAIRALPEHLPHKIKVNINKLKTFEDEILAGDLQLPEGVKLQREPEEIVALVVPPGKIEEEQKQPVEEEKGAGEVEETEGETEGEEEEKGKKEE